MPIVAFLSTVSDEFRAYRDQVVHVLIPDDVAHQNEMMSPVVTE